MRKEHAMEYSLRPAALADLQTVLTWVTTAAALQMWAGSKVTFPPRAQQTWLEIGAGDKNTFALVDSEQHVCGFGQLLLREPGCVHLARIIVSLAERGKGIGRLLVTELMRVGSELHHPLMFTLNVYRDNATARGLYASLGFTILSEDQEKNMVKMGLRCDLPDDSQPAQAR
jgi:ribosomal protein S18 acetylase RimI-like enzyme